MPCTTIQLDTEPSSVLTSTGLHAIARALAKSTRCISAVGAGISTRASVPDFRSKRTGLYSIDKVEEQATAAGPSQRSASTSSLAADSTSNERKRTRRSPSGQAMFDASVYQSHDARTAHWQLLSGMRDLVKGVAERELDRNRSSASLQGVTRTHEFFGTLKRKNKLRRVYTQNVDGFETVATGLQPVDLPGLTLSVNLRAASASSAKGKGKSKWQGDVVQLHGNLQRVRCSLCDWVGEWDDGLNFKLARGTTIDCPQCTYRTLSRARQSKRALTPPSFVRPALVLYNEPNAAAHTIGDVMTADLRSRPDFLLVMGTSLKIPGFRSLVKQFAAQVKTRGGIAVYVNMEPAAASEWHSVFDYQVIGDTDQFVDRIVREWKRTKPRDWTTQQTLAQSLAGAQVTKPMQQGQETKAESKDAGPVASPRRPFANVPANTAEPVSARTKHSFSLVVKLSRSSTTPDISNRCSDAPILSTNESTSPLSKPHLGQRRTRSMSSFDGMDSTMASPCARTDAILVRSPLSKRVKR